MPREKLTPIQLSDVLEKLDAAIEQAEQLRLQIGKRIRGSRSVRPPQIGVPPSTSARHNGRPVARTSAKQ